MDPLLSDIEAFIERTGMSAWEFGEHSLNDRHLIRQLRNGRELRRSTASKIKAFMATYRQEAA